MNKDKIISLRMERQCFVKKANETEYIELYRDMQPGQSSYWNGFGQPPILLDRAAFSDLEFNRQRQNERELVKGRFSGGNLGWITPDEWEIFIGLYCKPMEFFSFEQTNILELIENAGPFTIQQLKQETGLLVKEITPILHRLQEAFLIYEDQYDGEWDRGWYKFEEMFPDVNRERYSRRDALKVVLPRFAYRFVLFDTKMAKGFYKLPERDIKAAVYELMDEGILVAKDSGYMLASDVKILTDYEPKDLHFVCALHRNDILYKAYEPQLKKWMAELTKDLKYDHEPLQYLLIDGEFHGACVGHFRNGPYDLNDIVCDSPEIKKRKEDILKEVCDVNFGRMPARFMGETLTSNTR